MSKITSIAVGLLTAISIVPAAGAMAAIPNTPAIQQPAENLHAQVILKIGPQIRRAHTPYYRREAERLDRLERRARVREARASEARARWEAERYDRYKYGNRRDYRY